MNREGRIEHLENLLETRPGLASSVAVSREIRMLEREQRLEDGQADEPAAVDPRELSWSGDEDDPLQDLDEGPPVGWKGRP